VDGHALAGDAINVDIITDFDALRTWDANANREDWQNSAWCGGLDDMGYCYGRVGRSFMQPGGVQPDEYDQWLKVYRDLKAGIDDRREIVTFWHPGTEELACLPACMHTHTFNILDGTLYLTSYQRSCDMPLGVPFNMVQVAWLLMVMAKITGLKPGIAYHKLANVHIYEDQVEFLQEQFQRRPYPAPRLRISDEVDSWEALMDESATTVEDFQVEDYQHHPAIKFPFSV
jgi:thymidylate synthase